MFQAYQGGVIWLKCHVCGKLIHIEHSEGELMNCLKRSAEYQKEIYEIIGKLRTLT